MDNRLLLLDCALKLFAERGYDAVGVQEIAQAAGVTKPTLYHYFGSKLGLLNELVANMHTRFLDALEEAIVYQGDLPLSLEKLTRAYFLFARQNPVYYRMQLAMYFAPQHSKAFNVITGYNEQQHQMVEKLFTAAVHDHGNMRGRQRLYAATFIGTLNTCIGLWLNGYLELDDTLIRAIVHQFQHGIYS